jgi:hypothetical protein
MVVEAKFFTQEVGCTEEPQIFTQGSASMARIGNKERKPHHGTFVQDNGLLVTGFETEVTAEQASNILAETYKNVRSSNPKEGYSSQAATTAASAFLTKEGVAIRGAGDALIAAISAEGEVVILNKLHTSGGQGIYNCLFPKGTESIQSDRRDDSTFLTWKEVEEKLGTDKSAIRIAVMSDGVSMSHFPDDLAGDLEWLIQKQIKNGGSITDADFSEKLLKASGSDTYRSVKADDITVVSAMRPKTNQEQTVLHAFDGVGSGGDKSAEVAFDATQAGIHAIADLLNIKVHAAAVNHAVPVKMQTVDPFIPEANISQPLLAMIFNRSKEAGNMVGSLKDTKPHEPLAFRESAQGLKIMQSLCIKAGIEATAEVPEGKLVGMLTIADSSKGIVRPMMRAFEANEIKAKTQPVETGTPDFIIAPQSKHVGRVECLASLQKTRPC